MTDHPNPSQIPTPSEDAPPRMPRWVKVAAVVVGLLVLLFVIAQLAGLGGEHGPGRHMSGDGPASTSDWTGPSKSAAFVA
jgi:hypothetical protein